MPYQIVWSEEHQAFAITGLISKAEMPEFKLSLEKELRAQNAAPRNWYQPLMLFLATLHTNNPKFIECIKLWREVSQTGLKEAKDYMEAVRDGREPPPYGDEYPDISPTTMEWVISRMRAWQWHDHVKELAGET
jgi:hypothetical protein